MTWLRRSYGAGLGHLAGFLASVAVAATALSGILQAGQSGRILIWFVAGILVHDLIALPLYSVVDRVLSRRPAAVPGPARLARLRTHVRVPAILSALLLLVFLPLISRANRTDYGDASSLSPDPYLHRWLIATAVLFGLSAVSYAAGSVVAGRRARAARNP